MIKEVIQSSYVRCGQLCSSVSSLPGAVQKKLSECSCADLKVYSVITLGRLLQAAAVWGVAESLAAKTTIPYIALGVISSLAVAILGCYVVDEADSIAVDWLPFSPYVVGQPVGLHNQKNDCWINSSLQLLFNSPNLLNLATNGMPQLKEVSDAYSRAQAEYQRAVPWDRDAPLTGFIRDTLRKDNRINSGDSQEDLMPIFEFLFQEPHQLYELPATRGDREIQPRKEHVIAVDVKGEGRLYFNKLFNEFFNYVDDSGGAFNLKFPTPPDDLLIQLKRFSQSTFSAGSSSRDLTEHRITFNKNEQEIEVPSKIALDKQYSKDEKEAQYVCDGFIVCSGHSLNSGHYIAYIQKPDGLWWQCDDGLVQQISKKYAAQMMQKGYLYHFKKVV